MKQIPMIEKFMTSMPQTVGTDMPVATALSMMRENGFRHLPVQNGGRLVGVLTDRDIKLVSSFDGAKDLIVEEAMTPDPYVVAPDSTLDSVVREMADHKYGCAIVCQGNGKVVGIFTATDGLRVLGDVLKANFKERLR